MSGHNNIEVKASGKEGLGIFALRDIEAGEYIHAVEYEREITEEAPLNEDQGERHDHCTYADGKVLLVAFPARHTNHSCDPNAFYRYAEGMTKVYARRLVNIGEEITVDYLINNAGGNSWPCHCGVPRCRGTTGTSFFDLPIDFQEEYYPLLALWFKKRFAERLSAIQSAL